MKKLFFALMAFVTTIASCTKKDMGDMQPVTAICNDTVFISTGLPTGAVGYTLYPQTSLFVNTNKQTKHDGPMVHYRPLVGQGSLDSLFFKVTYVTPGFDFKSIATKMYLMDEQGFIVRRLPAIQGIDSNGRFVFGGLQFKLANGFGNKLRLAYDVDPATPSCMVQISAVGFKAINQSSQVFSMTGPKDSIIDGPVVNTTCLVENKSTTQAIVNGFPDSVTIATIKLQVNSPQMYLGSIPVKISCKTLLANGEVSGFSDGFIKVTHSSGSKTIVPARMRLDYLSQTVYFDAKDVQLPLSTGSSTVSVQVNTVQGSYPDNIRFFTWINPKEIEVYQGDRTLAGTKRFAVTGNFAQSGDVTLK